MIINMELTKAHFDLVDGNDIRLTMPISKINKSKRTVSGWATLDSVDTQGDIITAEASRQAFSDFMKRGNLRLMHQPIPVGKMLNFKEQEFFDVGENKKYQGIYVDAYISEGAEDVWKMVLDGTLQGFSIGGAATDTESKFVKSEDGSGGRTVRFIKSYKLTELSLVDSPANQLANFESIQKLLTIEKNDTTGEEEVGGIIADVDTFNVFYCDNDHNPIAVESKEDNETCSICQSSMTNIGWFENIDGGREEKLAEVVKKYLASNDEGGVEADMPDEKVEKATVNNAKGTDTDDDGNVVVGSSEAVEVDENAERAAVAGDQEVKEAEEVSEVDEEETDLAKVLDKLKDDITNVVESGAKQSAEQISALEKRLAEVDASFAEKFADFEKTLKAHDEKFSGLEEGLNKVLGSVNALENETAVRKSSDLGGSDEKLEKRNKQDDPWAGTFVPRGFLSLDD